MFGFQTTRIRIKVVELLYVENNDSKVFCLLKLIHNFWLRFSPLLKRSTNNINLFKPEPAGGVVAVAIRCIDHFKSFFYTIFPGGLYITCVVLKPNPLEFKANHLHLNP